MKKRFTDRDAEDRLRRLPKLRLDAKRRNEILQRTLSQADARSSKPGDHLRRIDSRRRWGPITASATALVLVSAGVLYANGRLGTGPVHAHGNRTSTTPATNPNNWMTNLEKRDLVAQAVSNMFHGQPPASTASSGIAMSRNVPIVSMSPTQDGKGQTVYQVKMKGTFTHNHRHAAYLSFLTAADGSKVWDIKATAGSSQTQWTMKKSMDSQVKQFVYSGGNNNWTGVYRQATVQIWRKHSATKNSTTTKFQFGSSHTSKGMVWYSGSGSIPKVTAYSVKGGGQGSNFQSSSPDPRKQFSLPQLGIVLSSENIHVSITANGHKETFLLRDAGEKNTKSIPLMKVVSIQPQEGGVLIRLQGKAQPVKVAIDSKQTYDGNGSTGPKASFIIRDATPVNKSVTNFTKFNQGGNQFIRSISVKPQGKNLLVQLKLKQTVNTLNAGASGSYMGIALQNQPSAIPKFFEHPHAVGKLPGWFVTDMLFATFYEGTPMKPVTYGQMLPRKSSGKYLLAAPTDAKANPGDAVTYTSYFGAVPLFDIIKKLIADRASVPASKVHTGSVKEVQNGKATAVKATLLDMDNGWGIGFAKHQVIVYSQHGGFYTYTVYPVPNILLG